MGTLDDFKDNVGHLIDLARQKVDREKLSLARMKEERERKLLVFDENADRIQSEIIDPRIKHLASLFDNAFKPKITEEVDYRHRTHLHFGHTDRFPCTADLTILIVHSKDPEYLKMKFEYTILPAYVTENFKFEKELRVKMDEENDAQIISLLESGIEEFLRNYMQVYKG